MTNFSRGDKWYILLHDHSSHNHVPTMTK